MAITKQFLSGQRVLLSFTLSINAAYGARKAFLLAEFNDWQPVEMCRDKTGGFILNVEVDGDKPEGYEYRFVLQDEEGSERFTNDWHADDYRQNAFGSDNSVVHVVVKKQDKPVSQPAPVAQQRRADTEAVSSVTSSAKKHDVIKLPQNYVA